MPSQIKCGDVILRKAAQDTEQFAGSSVESGQSDIPLQ